MEKTVTVDSSEIEIKNILNENPHHRWYLVKPVVQAQDITDNNNVEIQPLQEITEEVTVHTATLSAQLIVEGVVAVVITLLHVEEVWIIIFDYFFKNYLQLMFAFTCFFLCNF